MRRQQHPIVGLDVGYGVTKGILNGSSVAFPSVASHARAIKFKADELTDRYPGEQLVDADGQWFIGDLARSQARPGELIRLRGRTADEANGGNLFRARMMRAALGKLLPDRAANDVIHLVVATGLPVDHMPDAGVLKDALTGQHRVSTDTADFVANVTRVLVMPQPYGTIYRHMLTTNGEVDAHHTAQRTGVVDVGTYTVDVTLDDDGEYIDRLSGSSEAGVYLVADRVAAAYEREFRTKPSERDVESVLKSGYVRVRGDWVDYRHVRQEAAAELVDAALTLIRDRWGAAADVDVIYLAGGGAGLVAEAVGADYPQARLTPDAQMSNARGYLNYALLAQREGQLG